MKRILFAGAMALAASPALAADLIPPPAPPPQAPATYVPTTAPVYNWGGIYIGINGGYAFGNSDWTPSTTPPRPATGNFNVDGALVGGTLGADFQTGQFVFGVEGDIDWTDIKGSVTNTTTCGVSCTFQTSNDWLGTVRGRAGFAIDRVLLYATGGGAFGDVKATLTKAAGTGSTDTTKFGWTAGAGVEFAITENITAKAEYLFVDLQNGSFACTVALCGAVTTVPVSFDTSLIRAGLNFKFNAF